nr:soluble inorganic pyrophosphatase 4 [Tanacetum cinerariifolium]
MRMIDQGEKDDKIIAVYDDDHEYRHYNDIKELPPHRLAEIYKKNENKEVAVNDFLPAAEAIEVSGKSIGIIGLERIGLAIAKRMEAFGCPIRFIKDKIMKTIAYYLFDVVVEFHSEYYKEPTELKIHEMGKINPNMIRRRNDILEEDMPPRRRFSFTAPPPGCDIAENYVAAARAPRSQYNFVDTVEAEHGLIRSPGYDAQTIARAADRADDVGYTDRRDIRLEIDIVRGQRTAYEIELQEVHKAYLSFKARNRALLARIETLKTHMSHMEWQRQSAEDPAVTQMMRIHALEARARTDTVEDASSSCYLYFSFLAILIMPVTRQGTNDAMTPESIQAMIDRAIQRNSSKREAWKSLESSSTKSKPSQNQESI